MNIDTQQGAITLDFLGCGLTLLSGQDCCKDIVSSLGHGISKPMWLRHLSVEISFLCTWTVTWMSKE